MTQGSLALVTGAPGWLGNRLVRHLKEPHPDWPDGAADGRFERIRCLVLPGAPRGRLEELSPGVEMVEGDIRDPGAVGRFCSGAQGATLFHLAGLIHPALKVSEIYEINTGGSRHLIAAAAAAGVRRIVATSSNSPAGTSRDPDTVFDESSPYHPYMAYGRSKKLMEDDLNAAHRAGAIEATIMRPCWFYGPEQPPRQSTFFRMIKEGKAPIVGSGESRRSMSYVDNTALGLLLAAATPDAAGETYWLADERPYTMNEIVDTVEELLEREFGMEVAHDRMRLPSLASEVALAVDSTLQWAGLYQQKIHVLSEMNKTIACSVAKAREQLGYRPGVELREGMRRSIEWCLAAGQTI
jgi:nucleoside-diphosphate-sugar epimerase